LWKVSASGGWPVQLLRSDERQYSASWSPDGKWITFEQDTAGDELWDIFVVSSDGGAAINLTGTADVREQAPRWSPDGKAIAISFRPKNSSASQLALLDFATQKVKLLTSEPTANHHWSSVAWSADGTTLYANRDEIGYADADVYAINVVTGDASNLTAHQAKARYLASSLSPDGKTLLLTSNEKGGFDNVALLDLASRKRSWITNTRWEASAGDFSPTGDALTYTINADGQTSVYLYSIATRQAEKLSLPNGLNSGAAYPNSFSPTGDRLLLTHESSVTPADFWIHNLASHDTRRLSNSAIASLTATPMPEAQVIHYKSFDGKIISALLWMPFNLKRDGKNPVLVLPHGGPTGQVQEYFNPRVAAFVSRGYICIAPNFRGSTGYGKDFEHANFKDLGGGDLKDVEFAARFLQSTGYVDAKKIGITGGSYGGFMTLMAIGKAPDIWAAAVEMYGIINWLTLYEHEDPWLQQYEKTLLGDPVKDRAVYLASSPVNFLHEAKAPLLVLQGDNDTHVPKEEAEQVVDLLQKNGGTVDVHYYSNEGHGFAKRENQIDSIRRTVEWFDKYLK
jgi:dipeptidyl aminopeptidase/acylaminoacyl peptidase